MESLHFASAAIQPVQLGSQETIQEKFMALTKYVPDCFPDKKDQKLFFRDVEDCTFRGVINFEFFKIVDKLYMRDNRGRLCITQKEVLKAAFYYEAIGDASAAVKCYLRLIEFPSSKAEFYIEKCRKLVTNHWDWLQFLEQLPDNKKITDPLLECKRKVDLEFKAFLENIAYALPPQTIFFAGDDKENSPTSQFISKIKTDLSILNVTVEAISYIPHEKDYLQHLSLIQKCEKVILVWTREFTKHSASEDLKNRIGLQARLINSRNDVNSLYAIAIEGKQDDVIRTNIEFIRDNVLQASDYYHNILWVASKLMGGQVEELKKSFSEKIYTEITKINNFSPNIVDLV